MLEITEDRFHTFSIYCTTSAYMYCHLLWNEFCHTDCEILCTRLV